MSNLTRGFKRISVDHGITFKMPRRATKNSAGYDIFLNSFEAVIIQPRDFVVIATGLSSYMLPDEVLKIYPRSSLGFKYNVRLKNSTAIIDADFKDQIKIALYNPSESDSVEIKPGQAYCQGIFQKYLLADDDDATEERTGGFGSTDGR